MCPYPGPYTQLRVGQTGVIGTVVRVFTKIGVAQLGGVAGLIQADGDWPEASVCGPSPDQLTCGRFQYNGWYLQVGARRWRLIELLG